MSIVTRLLSFLGRSLKIEISKAYSAVDMCDLDKDGYISASELFELIHRFAKECK